VQKIKQKDVQETSFYLQYSFSSVVMMVITSGDSWIILFDLIDKR